MALIEEYYELDEAEEVSPAWKIIQIAFYVLAGCFGLWCGYTMALLRLRFDDKCYLFTIIKLSISKENEVETGNINWESDLWCDYCQYSMVSSFIVATIWAAFFLMCGKGGKSLTGLPQPWRIVWPSLIFNFIYFIISLSTTINIQEGTDDFCYRRDFDKRIQAKSLVDNCQPLQYLLKKNLDVTSLQLEIVVKTSWACTASWFILFLTSFFRIIFVIDFQMYKVCVFKIGDTPHNKKEAVLRITNYEEPKKLQFQEDNIKISYIDFKEKFEDAEGGKVRKGKAGKKIPRQTLKPTKRSLTQVNAAFYVATDLRMLNREKKIKNVSKYLDEAFEKNTNSVSHDIKKINTAVDQPQKPFDSNTSALGSTTFFNKYDMDFEEFSEEEECFSDMAQKEISDFSQSAKDDILVNNFDLRQLKKRL